METKSWGLLMLIINIFFPGIGSIIAGLKGAYCCAAPPPFRAPRGRTLYENLLRRPQPRAARAAGRLRHARSAWRRR